MTVERFDMTRTTVGNPAMARDVEAIRALWGTLNPTAGASIDTEFAREVMAGDEYFIVRDEETGRIVGVQSLRLLEANLGVLESIAVDERKRKQGIGAALIKTAISHAFSEGGCETIMTTALESSQGILSKAGFETFEITDSGAAIMFLDK